MRVRKYSRVRSWHSGATKAEPMARELIDDFKSGRRDALSVWSERDGEPVLTRYMAVRDTHGDYVGTMECVERMGEAAAHFRK